MTLPVEFSRFHVSPVRCATIYASTPPSQSFINYVHCKKWSAVGTKTVAYCTLFRKSVQYATVLVCPPHSIFYSVVLLSVFILVCFFQPSIKKRSTSSAKFLMSSFIVLKPSVCQLVFLTLSSVFCYAFRPGRFVTTPRACAK